MNDIIKSLICLTQDQITFWLFQSALLLILVYALIRPKYEVHRKRQSGLSITVERGEKSIGYFRDFANSFISIILIVVISIADTAHGYKVFIFLIDITIVLYLSYWNSWSRNKLVGIYEQIKQKKEKH